MSETWSVYAENGSRLEFLILTMPDKEIVSVSLREGIDFLDDLYEDFGDFYILETG